MARAHSVYVVCRSGLVYRTYTVKHECKSFLALQSEDELILMQVIRMRDGGDMTTQCRWPARQFLNEV